MDDPVRMSFSQEELHTKATLFMIESFGTPKNMTDQDQKDRWYERYGLLITFLGSLWTNV